MLAPVTSRTQLLVVSAITTRPVLSMATPPGALSETPVAAPAKLHVAVAPPPATWLIVVVTTLRMQLLPVSAMNTLPLLLSATAPGALSVTVVAVPVNVHAVLPVPPPATWLIVVVTTLRTQLLPVSAMKTLPLLLTATPRGPASVTVVAVPENVHAVLPVPPPATWLTVVPATLRMQLLPVSAM